MERIKVACVFGTRPEAIKMAPVVLRLKGDDRFDCTVIITAQHRYMLDQVLEKFDIKPDFDLDIMKDGQTISDITARVVTKIGEAYKAISPDVVLVHGDTTTTFAAALAAFYAKIKVGHVEAGLRSFDKMQPFPEEMNRKLASCLCDIHLAPTDISRQNLLNESVGENDIFVTGNTVIDAIRKSVSDTYVFSESALNEIDYAKNKVVVMTAHRRENLGEPLENIFAAVNRLTQKYADSLFVYAVHKNPLVSEPASRILGGNKNVLLLPPLDIDDMHNLIARSYLVLTDSGGLQEEAPAMNKPVVVLRNVTERPEGLLAGTLALAGCDTQNVFDCVSRLFDDETEYAKMSNAKNPFGDGLAADRIADTLLYRFGRTSERPADYRWQS